MRTHKSLFFPWVRSSVFTNPWVRKLKIHGIRARKEPTDKGKDFDCINIRH